MYDPPEEYHKWYYDNEVWEEVRFLGVVTNKSVSDMWNYQEILTELQAGCRLRSRREIWRRSAPS